MIIHIPDALIWVAGSFTAFMCVVGVNTLIRLGYALSIHLINMNKP